MADAISEISLCELCAEGAMSFEEILFEINQLLLFASEIQTNNAE